MATWMGAGIAVGEDSRETALQAVEEALEKMGHKNDLKLVIVYAWPHYDLQEVLNTIREATGNSPLLGCTSSGEFTENDYVVGGIAVTTIASDHMNIKLNYACNFTDDIPTSVSEVVSTYGGTVDPGLRGRTLLLYTDALMGHGEELIDEIMLQTDMQYQLFGAAAADDVMFKKTQIFFNNEIHSNAFVCAEILSEKPFSIAAQHGWIPMEGPYRVTHSEGSVLHELNGQEAWKTYQKFAEKHGLIIPKTGENGFLMQYILGIETENEYKLRVPLSLNADGSLGCAAEVPEGAKVYIMKSEQHDVLNGGKLAIEQAKHQLDTQDSLAGALVCECVATRLQLGDKFSEEITSTASELNPVQLSGLASYGQLARTSNKFSGLGCATSLVCLIPN